MNRALSISALALLGALAGCGDNIKGEEVGPGPVGTSRATLVYTDPSGGKLRLIKDPASTLGPTVTLDFVVGEAAQTGYATGFDLPLAAPLTVSEFTPGTALAPGEPAAARALVPTTGPLANNLVAAQSQKATGTGAVTTDTTLAPGTLLYKVTLTLTDGSRPGVMFDGAAPGFVLPTGGLRDRAGNTVVEAKDVAIGKLELIVQ
ncbi:MAG: hypothetical protein K8W52_05900 [Deltaproteobacteria bacterium]|nr:hypothetical protein [Deltaproteobacteria bacterium]